MKQADAASQPRYCSVRLHGVGPFASLLCLLILLISATNCWDRPLVTLGQSDADIVFVSYQPRDPPGWLYLLSIEDKQWSKVLGAEYSVSDPVTWAPDGDALAFVGVLVKGLDKTDFGYGMEGVILLDDEGQTTVFKPCCFSPAWSPDGAHIVFHKDCLGSASLNIAHIDGSDEREVVNGIAHHITENNFIRQLRLSWSPDGQHITYDNPDAAGQWYIWVVNIEGDSPERLTRGRHPAWSPHGDEIAFDRDGDIWFISVNDGSESKLVLPGSIYAEWPTWSPDGLQLAFAGGQGTNAEIYIVNRDGTGLNRLTDNSVWDGFPAWRPRQDR